MTRSSARARPAVFAALALWLPAAGCPRRAAPPSRPHRNVVVWLVDTLRADHVGCYGYERDTTPHFDALARRGVRFAAFHATSNWTQPSIASFFTGVPPPVFHGDFSSVLPSSLPTAALAMRRAGYATTGITVSVATAPQFGFDRDFENYVCLYRSEPKREWKRRTTTAFEAARVVDAALAWLDGTLAPVLPDDAPIRPRGDRPFFLFLHTLDPHLPYHVHEGSPSFADPAYRGAMDGSLKPIEAANERGWDGEGDTRDLAHLRDLYDGEIAYNDAQFGRLLAGLAARGLLEETYVVVVADHGEELGERGFYGHGHHNLHRGLTHVPFLVAGPELRRGVVVDRLASGVDFLPTLLELAGVAIPHSVEGRSFAPLLLEDGDGEVPLVERIYVDRARSKRDTDAVRSAQWFFQRSFAEKDGAPVRELFDLRADPAERVDVAGRRRDVARALFQALLAWKKALNRRRDLWGEIATGELDEATRARLEQLGYLQR